MTPYVPLLRRLLPLESTTSASYFLPAEKVMRDRYQLKNGLWSTTNVPVLIAVRLSSLAAAPAEPASASSDAPPHPRGEEGKTREGNEERANRVHADCSRMSHADPHASRFRAFLEPLAFSRRANCPSRDHASLLLLTLRAIGDLLARRLAAEDPSDRDAHEEHERDEDDVPEVGTPIRTLRASPFFSADAAARSMVRSRSSSRSERLACLRQRRKIQAMSTTPDRPRRPRPAASSR